MEAEGFKVNVGKAKVMTGGEGLGTIEEFSSYPCGVCCKGVGDKCIKSLYPSELSSLTSG